MSSVSGALPFPFSLIWFLGLTAARSLYRYLEGLQWSIEALFQVPSVEEWVNSSNTLAISSGCLLVVIRRCRSHPLQACFHCRINPWASLDSCRPDVSSDFSAAFLSSLPCPSWPTSSPSFQGLSIFFPSRFSLSFNLVQFIPLLRLFFFFCSCPVFYAVFILLCYFFWIPGSHLRFLSLSGGNPGPLRRDSTNFQPAASIFVNFCLKNYMSSVSGRLQPPSPFPQVVRLCCKVSEILATGLAISRPFWASEAPTDLKITRVVLPKQWLRCKGLSALSSSSLNRKR